MQHLVAWTSEYAPLADNHGWATNGAGFKVSVKKTKYRSNEKSRLILGEQSFWFRSVECRCFDWSSEEMGHRSETKYLRNRTGQIRSTVNFITIQMKFEWSSSSICFIFASSRKISAGHPLEIDFQVNGCEGENNVVRFLEHIQLYVTISYTRRGALKINITSPHGIWSNSLLVLFVFFQTPLFDQVLKQHYCLNVIKTLPPTVSKIGHLWVYIIGVKIPKDYGQLKLWIQCVWSISNENCVSIEYRFVF